MKKICLLAILIFVLASCSSDDQQEPAVINHPVKKSELIGVWADGDYFMSFGEDDYFAAYLSEDYLACGAYELPMEIKENELYTQIEDSIIVIRSKHFKQYSIFQVLEVNNTTLKVSVIPQYSISLTLHKINQQPATYNPALVGKSYMGITFADEYTANQESKTLQYFLFNNRLYLYDMMHISVWDLSFNSNGEISSHKVIVP